MDDGDGDGAVTTEDVDTVFGGVDELDAHDAADVWRFLSDMGQWVKDSMLPDFTEHSAEARALMEAKTFIEATAHAPARERSDLPDYWTGMYFVLGPNEAVRIAPRDGLRTNLLIVSLSNMVIPTPGGNIAASNGWVTLSPSEPSDYGPGMSRNSIPPGGNRSYVAANEVWAIASAAGTVIEVTAERHDRGSNDSTSSDAE